MVIYTKREEKEKNEGIDIPTIDIDIGSQPLRYDYCAEDEPSPGAECACSV